LQQANLIGPPLKKKKKKKKKKLWRLPKIEGSILKYRVHTLWRSYIGEKGGHQLPKHMG
jgi:hypothetical protein